MLKRGFDRVDDAIKSLKRPRAEPLEQQAILHWYEQILAYQIGGSTLELQVTRLHNQIKKLFKQPKYMDDDCPTCPKDKP